MFVIRVGLFLNEIIKCYLYVIYVSLSLSKKTYIFIRVAYFNHAENRYKYFDTFNKKKFI